MIDLNRSRRGYNYKCFYWKRDVNGAMDNEELVHKTNPTGVFYAKIVSSKSNDKQDIAGVFRVGIEGITIETNDIVNLDKDDLIQFDGKIWLVGRVNDDPVQKNAEFGHKVSNKTTIELNKGE
jgi:hypothetical protein